MKNFEIIKGYYRQFDLKKEPRTEAPNGVSPDDQYNLAGRPHRCLGSGREVGLFANSNATETDRLSAKYVSYEGDSVEGNAKTAFFDGDIVRWKSNGRIPFGDMLLDFYLCGYITKDQMIKSAILQEKGNDALWANMTTKRFKCKDTGEWMVRFVPSGKSWKEEVEYTNQRSVA